MAMKTVDVHWAAGFLDGEGSFATCGSAARIQATQVELYPLKKLVRLFGGHISPKKLSGLSKKPLHSWAQTNINAIGVMFMLYDLMSPPRQRQIEKAVALWRERGARVGDRHYAAVLHDDEALAAMQRVHNGEGIVAVARDVGVSHIVLMHWLLGRSRHYLHTQLVGENQYFPEHRGPDIPDAEALVAMRRIQAGETTKNVAISLGLHHSAVSQWMSGIRRPHLLAQLQSRAGE